MVKPRRRPCVDDHATSGVALTPKLRCGTPLHQSLDYKKVFKGKCFRCLASNHQLVHCREHVRCLSCFGNGHFAKQCRASSHRLTQSRTSVPKLPIRSRLTFPPESIHSCISFSELPYVVAVASPAVTVMASNYLPGSLSQRHSHSRAAVVTASVMAVEVQRLQTKVVVLSCYSGPVVGVIRATDVAY
jgi:hypothetical protein